MSTGAVAAVVVVALVVVAIAAVVMLRGGAGAGGAVGLKRRFGPEYERTLARHDGDVKATRKELTERVRKFKGLDRPALSAQAQERYTESWAGVQSRFVDEPGPAVNEADRLLASLAAERGFPGADSSDHFDALSVHHPHAVQGYRHAHGLAERGPAGQHATEELRQALLGARELFDALVAEVRPAGDTAVPAPPAAPDREPASLEKSGASASASGEDEAEGAGEAVGSGSGRRGQLSQRFAALTGARRGHDDEEEHRQEV
ncbi:hypothetical protein [Actinacidiphila acididurans]|uniref:Secreted protein n=1 Tax=Actinacidiphila acididurans TaxID=2784346 RepID=A0ABS2U4V7_9ACTN|nr:hypothetical protein [Actinacidiphila acididurans]MBM9510636.1 hypothetical protein [Actinacidiphila acididurans]